MLKRTLQSAAALIVIASLACAQNGTIVKVDLEKKEVKVKVDGKNHVVEAASVKIIDSDGTETTIASLSKGDEVAVTLEDGSIKSIRKATKKNERHPVRDAVSDPHAIDHALTTSGQSTE